MSFNQVDLASALKRHRVIVKIVKPNGHVRYMTCTRNQRHVHTAQIKFYDEPQGLFTVWDFEAHNYRRFRWEDVELWAEIKFSR